MHNGIDTKPLKASVTSKATFQSGQLVADETFPGLSHLPCGGDASWKRRISQHVDSWDPMHEEPSVPHLANNYANLRVASPSQDRFYQRLLQDNDDDVFRDSLAQRPYRETRDGAIVIGASHMQIALNTHTQWAFNHQSQLVDPHGQAYDIDPQLLKLQKTRSDEAHLPSKVPNLDLACPSRQSTPLAEDKQAPSTVTPTSTATGSEKISQDSRSSSSSTPSTKGGNSNRKLSNVLNGDQNGSDRSTIAIDTLQTTKESHARERKKELYKTELCRGWEETGTCRYGRKCQYAHGEAELRPVQRHRKYKTQICKTYWETGACPYGVRCTFIHGEVSKANKNILYSDDSKNSKKRKGDAECWKKSEAKGKKANEIPLPKAHKSPSLPDIGAMTLRDHSESTWNKTIATCKRADDLDALLSPSSQRKSSKDWVCEFDELFGTDYDVSAQLISNDLLQSMYSPEAETTSSSKTLPGSSTSLAMAPMVPEEKPAGASPQSADARPRGQRQSLPNPRTQPANKQPPRRYSDTTSFSSSRDVRPVGSDKRLPVFKNIVKQ
ncbi:hypothetical protein BZG36_00350 [Bifiguratus adelaidae]|uniref:C3H1-type domain-containing protein n=1 Tax=Bifiguratus adelaidae TaxID=1938954 RepID=A0A261Y7R5_9FUNG|nr:hypothetical protein BZG36_00350 [Bifiguratus adelaidae]